MNSFKYKDFFSNDFNLTIIKEELYLHESPRKLSVEQEKEIVKLYTDETNPMRTVDIAKMFNVSIATIALVLKRNNITRRDSHARKLTPEQEKEIVKLYTDETNPLSTEQIAKIFNIPPANIIRCLERNNITRRDSRARKLTPEQEKEIVKLYTDETNPMRTVDIAKMFNVDFGLIIKTLKRYNIKRRKSGKPLKLTPEQEKEIVKLYTDETHPYSTHQIAKMFNVTHSTIVLVLKRNNIPRRDKSLRTILNLTRNNRDKLRTYHSTRFIKGQGNYFS